MRLPSLIGLFLWSLGLHAQGDFLETHTKLNDLLINKTGNELMFANDSYIYFADFNTLKVKDSIKIVTSDNVYIDQLQLVNGANPFVIIKTKNRNTYYQEFYEYPEDSLYIFNLNLKSVVNKFAGNLYANFNEKTSNQSVVAYNNFRPYNSPRTRKTFNSARQGGLQVFPEKTQVAASGIVRNLKINSKGSEVAIVYFDSIAKNSDYYYTLELRSLPNLEIINSKPIVGRPKSIYFSKDDSYLVLKKDYSTIGSTSLSAEEDVDIYESKTLKQLREIPNSLYIENVIENGNVWKKVKSEVINNSYGTNEIKHRIWSNLTPFAIIDGFVKINSDELLIYGNKGYGFSGEKNGIYKYSLSNNAIYSKNLKVAVLDTLFQRDKVLISNNKVNGDHPQLDRNKNIMQLHSGKKLQLWSTLDKRKLYDFEFDTAINAFLHPLGHSSFIFQSYEGKSFNEFKLRYLDLQTGIATTKLFTESDFNALRSKCFNSDGQGDSWLCNDGTARLWKINAKSKVITGLEDYSNPNYYRTDIEVFKNIPETNKVIIALRSVNVAPNHSVTESKFEGFKIYDSNTNTLTDISNLKENLEVFPVSSNALIFQNGTHLKLFNLKKDTSRNLQALTGYTISKIVKHKNVANIILENNEKFADSLLILEYKDDANEISNTFKVPYSTGHFLNDDGFHYKKSDQYFTYNSTLNENVVWENPESLYTQSTDLCLTLDGKMLFRNESLFNLNTLELEAQIPGFYNSVLLEENQLFYVDSQQYNVEKPFFQFKIGEQHNLESVYWESEKFSIKGHDYPNVTQFSKNKKFVLAYKTGLYEGQTLYLINLEDKTIKTKKIKFHLNTVRFSEDESRLVLVNRTNTFPSQTISQFYETNTFKLINEIDVNYSSHINTNSILHINGSYLVHSRIDANQLTEVNRYFARKQLSIGTYVGSKELIVAGSDTGELVFWNFDNQSPIKTCKVSDSEILKIQEINNALFILSKDAKVSIVSLEDLELEVTCSFFEKDQSVSAAWFTPEGYFKASKTDIRNFHFVKDGKVFPLLDYSLFLNRPDVLMKKVGFTPKLIYNEYKKAYLKRLSRNNYSENTAILSLKRPTVILKNRADITSITNKNNLLLDIQNTSNAEELTIYINGVPVQNEKIKNKALISTTIVLNNGMNRVSIITKTAEGIESDPITFETKTIIKREKSKVYYVGVGVSKYKDSSMNLKYADKDVRRLTDVFLSEFEGRIEIDTLLNQNVTKTNIKALKKKLKQTSIDDTVIISFSGHGLIGADNTFYFGVHDIDFDSPEIDGINYEEIQDLLTNIPARRKLLLLDACHSGELDVNENTDTNTNIDEKVTQNIPIGAKGSKAKKTEGSNGDTFQLMQSLFYDLDRGNGSYVISAAAGSEFAYEDDKWKNGVFTYSFINALYDLGYDTWQGDLGIPISKIKKYVYDHVKKLTNNKQQPTSRAENLEWDWVLE